MVLGILFSLPIVPFLWIMRVSEILLGTHLTLLRRCMLRHKHIRCRCRRGWSAWLWEHIVTVCRYVLVGRVSTYFPRHKLIVDGHRHKRYYYLLVMQHEMDLWEDNCKRY